VLVRGQSGPPYYSSLDKLVPCDAAGTPDFDAPMETALQKEEDLKIPEPVIPLVETRVNINAITAEELARRVPAIPYRVCKALIQQKLTQPGEVYRSLDQLRQAGPRVNWDEIFRSNLLFVG
jgi:hypothetical protein